MKMRLRWNRLMNAERRNRPGIYKVQRKAGEVDYLLVDIRAYIRHSVDPPCFVILVRSPKALNNRQRRCRQESKGNQLWLAPGLDIVDVYEAPVSDIDLEGQCPCRQSA